VPWYTFQNRQRTPSKPPESTAALPENTLAGLTAQVSQNRSELNALKLEWSEVLDKIGRWASRTAARERRRADRELDTLGDGSEIAEDAPGTPNGEDPAPSSPTSRTALKSALRGKIRRS